MKLTIEKLTEKINKLQTDDFRILRTLIQIPKDEHNECWIWKGALTINKNPGCREYKGIHPKYIIWYIFNNQICSHLDKLCHNNLCLNPKHFREFKYQEYIDTRIYKAYEDIRYRILVKTHPYYPHYGGRGIDMDPRYIGRTRNEGFTAFMDDLFELNMVPFPDGLSIDRIDNNKGYWKNNIRLATPKEQADNRRTTKITFEDAQEIRRLYKTGNYTMKFLAKKYNVHPVHISNIIHNLRHKI